MSDPVKFSFAKAASNVGGAKRKQDEPKDYVTGFAGNELISAAPQKKADGPRVIPLEGQGHIKRAPPNEPKPEPIADEKTHIKKEPDTDLGTSTSTANTSEKKEKSLDELAAEEIVRDVTNAAKPIEVEGRTVPLTVQNQIAGLEDITDDNERFKYDLESRPDEADQEAYEDMPIEDFGSAMLRGMGWVPGTAIGLNNKGLAEPIEFVKRPGYRLGLGATPKDIPVKKKKYIKPGESREPAPVMVAPTGPDGKVRHVKGISEKLVPLKKGLRAGDLVGIVSGPHEGLFARVMESGEDDDIVVRLESSSEDVVVSKSDVSIVDASKLAEGHPALKLMKKNREKEKEQEREERKEKDRDRNRDKDRDRDRERDSDRKDKSSSSSSKKSRKEDTAPSSSSSSSSSRSKRWIVPRILVRVVSKSFENGKYYNKKVRILDVVGDDKCIIQLDNGSLVEGVKQRMLETVIPPAGGKVMVVEGANKGRLGTLLERKKRGDEESAIVQMMGDLTIETFSLDDVAQYVGTFEEEVIDIL